jgi:hypothetical protein
VKQLLAESLRSAVASGLLILRFVVPLYILADILLYFDLLRYLGVLFTPFTSLLDLPSEAAVALAGGVLINIYAAIAFAAPLELTPYQWTVLAVFLGVCHSLVVEIGACLSVCPVLLMPSSWFGAESRGGVAAAVQPDHFGEMLLGSLGQALLLAVEIIALISAIIVAMDLLKSSRFLQRHLQRVNTSFSIIVGQLLGITYGAGILIREAGRGNLSRENIFFIGTFLMICHSLIEDVLLFVLFGANYWIIIGVRLTAALLISIVLLHLFRRSSLNRIVRP